MRISDWSSDVCSSDLLHGDGFRAYWSEDLTGVEIGGAAKNVMAIGVGIADGMSLGANTRAALITRGLAAIMRLAIAMGRSAERRGGKERARTCSSRGAPYNEKKNNVVETDKT